MAAGLLAEQNVGGRAGHLYVPTGPARLASRLASKVLRTCSGYPTRSRAFVVGSSSVSSYLPQRRQRGMSTDLCSSSPSRLLLGLPATCHLGYCNLLRPDLGSESNNFGGDSRLGLVL